MELYSITQSIVHSAFGGSATNGTNAPPFRNGELTNTLRGEDKVTLSREGKNKRSQSVSPFRAQESAVNHSTENLDQQELEQLRQLKQRDNEVRSHEQAHLSAAGRYAKGGASFSYQKGPDGASYAVGGEVGIDVSKESTPEATITKMRAIKRAALAPANPSGTDKRIAAQATAKESQARQELLQTEQEEVLRGKATVSSRSGGDQASSSNESTTGTSPSPGLTAKLAIYEKMAQA